MSTNQTIQSSEDARWPALERHARERFGVAGFRQGQRALIDAVLRGEDAIGVLATGGGKSLCYQLPALVLDKPVVVVSPLIALMQDQHAHLDRAHIDAAEMNSTLTAREERAEEAEIRRGEHPLIYVTPERLQDPECIAMLRARGVGLLAIDEAHCVSQWGHDFRPAYLGIRTAAEQLGRPPILALTATATPAVVADLVVQLGLRQPCIVRPGVARRNLAFEVRRTVSTEAKRYELRSLLNSVARGRATGTGILYCSTVRTVDELVEALTSEGVVVAGYHGKMTMHARIESQRRFMAGEVRLVVATKAFGLGIDKPDVRLVVHWQFPDSLDSYYQEAGRAGRDGAPARAILFYQLEDKRVQTYFLGGKYPRKREAWRICEIVRDLRDEMTLDALAEASGAGRKKTEIVVAKLVELGVASRHGQEVRRVRELDVPQVFAAFAHVWEERTKVDRERLETMMRYAQSTGCRERFLLEYFGEAASEDCGRCDNCRTHAARALAASGGTGAMADVQAAE